MPEYGHRFAQAAQYAINLHRNQRRKGSDVPYVAHLFGTASLVAEMGGDEDMAIAGLLHDAIEDHPREGATKREIGEQFGEGVLAIVKDCTNTHKVAEGDSGDDSPFVAGKKLYIRHLADLSPRSLTVCLCDKLHNARSTTLDLRANGEAVWKKFKGGKDSTLWYFRALAGLALETLPHPVLPLLLRDEVLEMHRLGGVQGIPHLLTPAALMETVGTFVKKKGDAS